MLTRDHAAEFTADRPSLRKEICPWCLLLEWKFISPSFGKDYQALKLTIVDQATLDAALDALQALALMLSKSLGLVMATVQMRLVALGAFSWSGSSSVPRSGESTRH